MTRSLGAAPVVAWPPALPLGCHRCNKQLNCPEPQQSLPPKTALTWKALQPSALAQLVQQSPTAAKGSTGREIFGVGIDCLVQEDHVQTV